MLQHFQSGRWTPEKLPGTDPEGVFRTLGAAEGFTDSDAFDLLEVAPGRILAGGRDNLLESMAAPGSS